MKKKVKKYLFRGALFIIIVFAGLQIYTVVYGFLFGETQDWQVLNSLQEKSTQLYKYKLVNGQFPQSLSQANISDRVCVHPARCFHVLYKPTTDSQDFKLAANVNYPFIAYWNPNWQVVEEAKIDFVNCCGGIATDENYKSRNDLPVYRKDTVTFPDPSLWPDLPKITFIERFLLLPIF